MEVILIKCHQNIVIRGHSIQISPIILDPRTEGPNGLCGGSIADLFEGWIFIFKLS